jgi:hypothetical protein
MVDLQEQVVENGDQCKCEDGIAIVSSMFIVDSRTSRDGIAVRAYRDHLPRFRHLPLPQTTSRS